MITSATANAVHPWRVKRKSFISTVPTTTKDLLSIYNQQNATVLRVAVVQFQMLDYWNTRPNINNRALTASFVVLDYGQQWN